MATSLSATTVNKLNGENWSTWKFDTRIILNGQGLFEIVSGEKQKPEKPTEVTSWVRDDAKAQTIIVTRMEPGPQAHILSCETAYDMWLKLKSVYDKESTVSIHLLQQRFFTMKFNEGTLSDFLSKLEEIRVKLKQAGEGISDKMTITKILMSLPEQYKYFRSAWESAPSEKQTLDELTSRLLLEEERNKSSTEQDVAITLVTHGSTTSKCLTCGKAGHMKKDCYKNKTCEFCKKCKLCCCATQRLEDPHLTAPRPGLLDDALNAVPESVDDKLNQALILVDILKSEYLKLLRERSESATTAAGIIQQPTCAATTAHSFPTDSSRSPREQNNQTLVAKTYTEWAIRPRPRGPGPVYPWGWPVPGTTILSRRFYDMMPQPAQPQYSNLYPVPHRPYRSNFPDYSYYYGPYRRSEYYDENPDQTRGHYRRKEYDGNFIEAASDSPERIVTTKIAAATPRKHSIKKTNARLEPDTNRRRIKQSLRIKNHNLRKSVDANEKKQSTNETKNMSNATGSIPTAKNTSATINGTGTAGDGTNTTTIAIISSSSRKIPKTKVTTHASPEVWPAFRFKTTLRIFLENSTPLPIPLPENNAFCFTNPNNALCRSP